MKFVSGKKGRSILSLLWKGTDTDECVSLCLSLCLCLSLPPPLVCVWFEHAWRMCGFWKSVGLLSPILSEARSSGCFPTTHARLAGPWTSGESLVSASSSCGNAGIADFVLYICLFFLFKVGSEYELRQQVLLPREPSPQPHIFEFNYEDSSNSKWINGIKESFCLILVFRVKKPISCWYADGLLPKQ